MGEKPEELDEIDERLGDLWSMSHKEQEKAFRYGLGSLFVLTTVMAVVAWFVPSIPPIVWAALAGAAVTFAVVCIPCAIPMMAAWMLNRRNDPPQD